MSWFFVGAAVLGAVSAISGADAQRRSAHTNADIARQKAKIAADQANVNEDAQRRRAALALGTERAAIDQSGGGSSGTNADLAAQSAKNAELDALNIRYSGKLGVLSNNEQAGLLDMSARDATTAGYLNAGASVLSSYGGYTRGKSKTGGGLS